MNTIMGLLSTYQIPFSVLFIVIGLAILVWSADQFVEGAAALANIFGVPPFLIGALIIGFGTSAPEMVVSVSSAMNGNPSIALGNAYGSNITNIALVLGATVLISTVAVQKELVTKELPILVAITLFASYQLFDGVISWYDALALLSVLAMVLARNIYQGLNSDEEIEDIPEDMSKMTSLFWVVVGFLFLVISSKMLVWGSVNIAQTFGVSDLVIGLTIVAIGTSLPELFSSIAAARKNEHELLIGNLVGSNIFNTLAVVGLAGIIHPFSVPALAITRDVPVMVAITLLLLAICFVAYKRNVKIGKIFGLVLLGSYVGYSMWLFVTATV